MKQVLHLPYPLSVNRYWRRAGYKTHISNAGRKYKQTVKAIGLRAGAIQHKGNMQVQIIILPKLTKAGVASKVLIDIDNGNKCILDALQGVLYEDDAQIKSLRVDYGEPVDGGGVIVEVGGM